MARVVLRPATASSTNTLKHTQCNPSQYYTHRDAVADHPEAAARLAASPVLPKPPPAGRVTAAYFKFDELCSTPRLARCPPGEAAAGACGSDHSGGSGGSSNSGGSGGSSNSGGGGGPLTAIDCLALAESGVSAVFLEGVPVLTPAARDAAARFVTLIDILYDHDTERECATIRRL